LLTIETGHDAETKAQHYLNQQGLKSLTRNYRCRWGEIDLIMQDGPYVVFVEVRHRHSHEFGDGVASITYAKKQKIIKTTSYYLIQFKLYDRVPIRFDVVSIHGKTGDITWIKDAFGTDY
jgi:putative endonuclease